MAIVRVYFHRDPKRLAAHVRYIAGRDGSHGLRGLGQPFRELRGDVEASIKLLQEHARAVRTQAGAAPREGPFLRLLFTLPDALAERVMAADGRLPKGSERVLRDAIEAVFRSAGRHLQGVYALHFHSTTRSAHPHVHVDLSPLDAHGRTAFLTPRQQEHFRDAWEREVERALVRAERHVSHPAPAHERPADGPAWDLERDIRGPRVWSTEGHAGSRGGARAEDERDVWGEHNGRHLDPTRPRSRDDRHRAGEATRDPGVSPRRRTARHSPDALHALARVLLGWSRPPVMDAFTRALLGRAQGRLRQPLPNLALRAMLGLEVPLPGPMSFVWRFLRRSALLPTRWP